MADAADDFLDPLTSLHGGRQCERNSWRSRRYGPAVDAVFDAGLALNPWFHRLRVRAAAMPRRRVLVTAVDVPTRRASPDRIVADLKTSRHEVTVALMPIGHLRDVTVSYSRLAAIAEARERLSAQVVRRDSRDLLRTVDVMRRL